LIGKGPNPTFRASIGEEEAMRSFWCVGVSLWTMAGLAYADPVVLSFQQRDYGVVESAASGHLEVVRTGDLSGTVTVKYATAHGTASASDYTPASGTLTFGPGVPSQTISIALTGDTAVEGDETVRVALLAPGGAGLGTPSVALLHIQDDDGAAVFLPSADYYVTQESPTILSITVRRSGPLTSSASVRVMTQNGTAVAPGDFAASDTVAMFEADSPDAAVSITIREDTLAEGVEAFQIVLSSPVGPILGTQRKATVTIVDNDAPVLPVAPLALGEYHGWFGLPSHTAPFSGADWKPHARPYDSRDLDVMRRHIVTAKARGLHGFLYNWYGSTCPQKDYAANDCRFMDDNVATLIRLVESEHPDFKIALLYDEGAVTKRTNDPGLFTERIREDLAYAHDRGYFSSIAALRLNGRPAVFVFPYDDVDPFVDWAAVRQGIAVPITLLERDPTSTIPFHDEQFDGHYPWVRPTGLWLPNGRDWGRDYLVWFYETMASPPYANRIAAGGIWGGFDDSLIPPPWGQNRYMARHTENDTRVLHETRQLAVNARVTILETWNDIEEGTDHEYTDLDAATDDMIVEMEPPDRGILVRSSPLQVTWDPVLGDLTLQLYKDSALFYEHTHSPGVFLNLAPGCAYEVKIWVAGTPIAKTIKVRHQDRIPGVTPVDVPNANCAAVP
jgi:hypothetical protein